MINESSDTVIIDEIDRLSVAYDKAKEYIGKISSSIDQQIDLWQYRRQIILDQVLQMKSSTSCDFLLPKTQRINELTIEAVEALCRVDLLLEQILRMDPKSRVLPTSTSFSTRTSDTSHVRQPTPSLIKQQSSILNGNTNGQYVLPVPVIRTQQATSSGRLSTLMPQEKTSFKPVILPQPSASMLGNTSRLTPIQPQSNHQHFGTEGIHIPRPVLASYGTRTPQSEHGASLFKVPTTNSRVTNYQPQQQLAQPHANEKIKLQRIPPGTKWHEARIEIIDSLSGFYVENLDPRVQEKFCQMQKDLEKHYDTLEATKQLKPLTNLSIGDFGVARYSDDGHWYRGRLITCEEHDSIKIVFVDYGNIEVKSIDDFYPLDKIFTELPAQAIGCSLSEASPRTANDDAMMWPEETIQLFKNEVANKVVEVHFANHEEGTEHWPLHFVRIFVGNQSVTNLLNIKQHIDPRPNRFIADKMAPNITEQEYILFNVPVGGDFER